MKRRALYALFFFSGISGLVYETVWLRMLIRVLGSTVYATSIILAAFMAGLALGSYLFGKYGGRSKNKLWLYASLELCIGVSAFILTFLFRGITPLYKSMYGIMGHQRAFLSLFQMCFMFLLLLLPTTLMGGTLPILVGYTRK